MIAASFELQVSMMEADIVVYLLRDIVIRCNMEVSEQLCFHPAVNGFHGGIICRGTSSGHRPGNVIHRKKFVVALGSINRALVAVKDQLLIRKLLLELNHILQSVDIGHAVPAFGGSVKSFL